MLDRQKRTRSLVAYAFVLVCILLAAALGAGAYLYYSDYQRHYRVQVENQLSAIGKLKADDLANWRGERLADASALHRNAAFAALAKRYLDDPGDPQAEAELRSWLESFQEYQQYDQVRLLDAQGATRLSVPAGVPPVAPAISERLPEILQSGRVTFLDFYRDDHDQRAHLAVLVPIVDGEGSHQALGAVVLRIDPTPYLYPFIARWPTPSETAETLLVRRDGNDALFLNEVRFQKDTALTLRIPLASRDVPAVKAALGQEGIVEGVDYRGVRVIADVRSVPDSPWFLVACMDAAEVYAPVRERLWQLVIVVAALLFGAGACVGLAWRQRSGQFYRERAAAVETIRETRDYLENLINHASAPIIVWDPQFRITRFNRAFESLTGRRADDVTGKSLEILFPRASLGSSMELIKKTQTGERWETAEIATLHLDGSVRTVLWNLATLFSADGKTPVATIAQGQDVTERKRVEENTRRMVTVVRDSNDALTIQDFEGRITAWNRGAELMYGYSEEEALQMNIERLTAPGKVEEQEDFTRRLLAGEAITSLETQRVTQDGRILDIWMTVTKLVDDTGKPVGIASTERDITERKRTEEALKKTAADLERSNKELEQFASVASHDLQEPLRMISSYTQLLAQRYEGQLDEKTQKYIGYAVDGALRMQRLIDDLLIFSRIGTRGGPLERMDSGSALAEAINNLGTMVEESGAILTHDELPTVRVKPSQLVMVFQNLLSNAIKFHSEAPPRVHVSAEDQGREWVFSVKDNGIGIDPQYKDRVFVIFQRLHTGQEYPGTGIGLAVCQRIVERHGGKIWFESEPGRGSTFYFTIPK
jgi:PAS domain S-box-containing protein